MYTNESSICDLKCDLVGVNSCVGHSLANIV